MYLEDLSIGQKFVSSKLQISTSDILAFAKQFDPQPFHLDHEQAKETLFQGLAASGWHTSAITMKLLTEGKGLPISSGVIGAGGELSWPMPVRPDDTLQVETTILEIHPSRSKPDRGRVKVENRTINQDGETVQFFIASLVVFRKPC